MDLKKILGAGAVISATAFISSYLTKKGFTSKGFKLGLLGTGAFLYVSYELASAIGPKLVDLYTMTYQSDAKIEMQKIDYGWKKDSLELLLDHELVIKGKSPVHTVSKTVSQNSSDKSIEYIPKDSTPEKNVVSLNSSHTVPKAYSSTVISPVKNISMPQYMPEHILNPVVLNPVVNATPVVNTTPIVSRWEDKLDTYVLHVDKSDAKMYVYMPNTLSKNQLDILSKNEFSQEYSKESSSIKRNSFSIFDITYAKNNNPENGLYEVYSKEKRSGSLYPGVIKFDSNQPNVVITGDGNNALYRSQIRSGVHQNNSGIRMLSEDYLTLDALLTRSRAIVSITN